MTPAQYYFPYLFSLQNFNDELSVFELKAVISHDNETGMPDQLLITGSSIGGKLLLSLPFGITLMVQGDKLLYWETDTNLVDIRQIGLEDLTDDPWIINTKIDLATLHIGKNEARTYLDTDLIVTFARKDSITYNKASYEQFVILIVEKEQVNVVPFDWFNKTNSQYDYTWPATARLDPATATLYGQGMRMQPFCVQLDRDLL